MGPLQQSSPPWLKPLATPLIATHYNQRPHLKLDQTKCNIAVYIKNLLVTPPKMVHDPSGECSLRKMYTKQMFVLVRMQLRNHVNTYIGSKAFQALQRLCGIYTILNLDCC